jgi:hypothetical protein
MAKEDFCFTFYDGDAARDVAHMDRTERGGYFDLVISQRKFGKLSLDRIKKTLGKDFESIWESIEIVLSKDDEGFYFIEWLENSLAKMRKHSGFQSINGKKGGRPAKNKPNENPNESELNPNESQKKPLGNENGNEYGNIDEEDKGGVGEKGGQDPNKFYPDASLHGVELSSTEFELTITYLENVCSKEFKNTTLKNQWLAPPEIERQWKGFKIQYFTGKQEYDAWSDVIQHFRDWLKRAIQKDKSDYGTTHRRGIKENSASFIP